MRSLRMFYFASTSGLSLMYNHSAVVQCISKDCQAVATTVVVNAAEVIIAPASDY
jgi:hypothetical protein